jgi:hypothetical protein
MPRTTKNKGTSATYQIFTAVYCTGGLREVSKVLDSCGWRCCGVVWNQALLPELDAGAANGLNGAVELTAAATAAAGTSCLASAS